MLRRMALREFVPTTEARLGMDEQAAMMEVPGYVARRRNGPARKNQDSRLEARLSSRYPSFASVTSLPGPSPRTTQAPKGMG